ncbi:MAG: hydrogenase maturation protease [Planctomycetes bacterium]|nr:hydrogenase maturation protease [Planctomycetota bacterium]
MSRAARRIVCVGSRFAPDDRAGPLVCDALRSAPLPGGVEVIDGGLGGLDLLRFVAGAERVVFVDAVRGFAPGKRVLLLSAAEASRGALPAYGHDGGLAYLLRALPNVLERPLPEVLVVGIEGEPDAESVARAAALSLSVATRGARRRASGQKREARGKAAR